NIATWCVFSEQVESGFHVCMLESRRSDQGWRPMRSMCFLLLLGSVGQAWAEGCIVHSQDERIEVKLCQQNRTIPAELFRSGFCQPQLKDQKVEVTFVEQCPGGAFGICRNAQVSN